MAEVKETKEALVALIKAGAKAAVLVKKAKADGKIDLADLPHAVAIFADVELMAAIQAGVDGADKIDDELKALDLGGGLVLAKDVIEEGLKALDEVKKA